jgi:hypothetical protein
MYGVPDWTDPPEAIGMMRFLRLKHQMVQDLDALPPPKPHQLDIDSTADFEPILKIISLHSIIAT